MYKDKTENVEIYFICYKKEDMDLVEVYYDEVLDVHSWYFNSYLAYKWWRKEYKKLKVGELGRILLTVAASKYIIYVLNNKEYKDKNEQDKYMQELKVIGLAIEKIAKDCELVRNL